MTTINIGNPGISIQFGPNEMLTVPDGDVWRVNITCEDAVRTSDDTGQTQYGLQVNGEVVASNEAGERSSSWGRSYNACSTIEIENAVFVGGDTITAIDCVLAINGFVVGLLPESPDTLGTEDESGGVIEEL